MDSSSILNAEDIQFHPLSSSEWRVSDGRFPKHSIEALLGFVAKSGGTYYATRMHHPREAAPLRSLDDVARFFAGAAVDGMVPVRLHANRSA